VPLKQCEVFQQGGDAVTEDKKSLCIVGCGYMGWHIALHCAVRGHTVSMTDVSATARSRAHELQVSELEQRVRAGDMDKAGMAAVLARLHIVGELPRAAAEADIVIEAVSEDLTLKRKVFSDLDRVCPPRTLFATNSSSIRISAIEDATKRPENVLNAHFMAGVWQRPVVELMRGTRTSEDAIGRMSRFALSIGMTPLVVQKESTGFIFNRVWRAIKKEALHLVDDGVASFEDVDRAWMMVFGTSIGPFGLMDTVGLDVVRDIELVYFGETHNASDMPPKLLLDKIAKGELGQKAGRGFYRYPAPAYLDPGWLRKEV
jgi:3-hydroxybutyryl-CoA dehydrogenase